MRSEAASVDDYIRDLPEDRRAMVTAVRDLVLANLADGIIETMSWGMISYEIPLALAPDTYNGKPLLYAALASQKQYCALYLMAVYGSDLVRRRFESAYQESGKRMDIGKSCVRFRRLEDLPFEAVAEAISSVSLEKFLEMHEQSKSLRKSGKR